ncbi:MAG: nucleotidyltransferase domain-containing protein [Planctomycetes bacterium]|nr:nucleotidyltransferase domain-containing protein [Planctomycetota bacterium]
MPDFAAFIEAHRRRREAERQRRAEACAAACRAAERCARILAEEFDARRVWLYGSALCPERFHDGSDIDLAVDRFPDRGYFRALARLAREAGRPVDLVPLDEAWPSVRDRIQDEGLLLLGRT